MMAHREEHEFCLYVKKLFPNYFNCKKVLDVGSLSINGSNRKLFEQCEYIGLDLGAGENVDVVSLAHEYDEPDNSFDVILSTETFEHDMYLSKTLANIIRLLKSGGLFFFACATTGRAKHGTRTIKPETSPFTAKMSMWRDYYKNLTEKNIRAIIDIDAVFGEYKFEELHIKMSIYPCHDLRFWGIKK